MILNATQSGEGPPVVLLHGGLANSNYWGLLVPELARHYRVVVIDSLNGYLNAMTDGRFLILQMHELLSYLSQLGVLTILVLAQHGLVGPMDTPLEISYLSDAVIMLRYFEFEGEVRRALSVIKKRSGDHEHTIREFELSELGLRVGPPLTQFTGIFAAAPHYIGTKEKLLTRTR